MDCKSCFQFSAKMKLKLTGIFIFRFPNSQKNELALGYTHCIHLCEPFFNDSKNHNQNNQRGNEQSEVVVMTCRSMLKVIDLAPLLIGSKPKTNSKIFYIQL